MHAGQIPTYEQLMLATDDPAAKNLLVDCDEHGRDKLASDTDQRVRDLLARIAQEKANGPSPVAVGRIEAKPTRSPTRTGGPRRTV